MTVGAALSRNTPAILAGPGECWEAAVAVELGPTHEVKVRDAPWHNHLSRIARAQLRVWWQDRQKERALIFTVHKKTHKWEGVGGACTCTGLSTTLPLHLHFFRTELMCHTLELVSFIRSISSVYLKKIG